MLMTHPIPFKKLNLQAPSARGVSLLFVQGGLVDLRGQ
jgi:hypothetical protein